MQRRQFGDEWWIEDVANRGMAILTQDARILRGSERVAIIGSNARIIALGNGNYIPWEKLRCVVQHWTAVERVLAATAASAVVLTLTGARATRFREGLVGCSHSGDAGEPTRARIRQDCRRRATLLRTAPLHEGLR
jgi:hypothetical protein